MSSRRTFTPEFKAQVVLELLSGAKSSAEVGREYPLAPQVVAQWKASVVERAATLFGRDEQQRQAVARLAELARRVGRLTLERAILNKATSCLPSRQPLGAR